jgi:sulfur-carrier protein
MGVLPHVMRKNTPGVRVAKDALGMAPGEHIAPGRPGACSHEGSSVMLIRWARKDALAMAVIRFTTHLIQHRPVRAIDAPGTTVAEVLATGLSDDPLLRGYVLDDQGRVRKHVNIYLDGRLITDRLRLSDAVGPASEIYVLQALSGG